MSANQPEEPYVSPWSLYQRFIYGSQRAPPFSTSLVSLRELARAKLPAPAFWYIAGSAGDSQTEKNNTDAFKEWNIVPRMLVDANARDLRVNLFGTEYSSPVFIGPVGVNGIFHEDGEEAVARAARRLGIPAVMSTAATRSIERFAEQNGDGQRWFQLYWPVTDECTLSLLKRAKASGFTTLVVTLDTTLLGHRPNDLDTAYLPFLNGLGCQVGFSDPVFCERMGIEPCERFEDIWTKEQVKRCSMAWLGEVNSGVFRTWKDLAIIRDNWEGPILLKGIQTVEDALLAQEHGMDGIIVSNHGGRQIDGSISSLEALMSICSDPRISNPPTDTKPTKSPSARFPNRKLAVLFDSGIRNGTDVIKALSLGADAVLLGRPWVYGLALAGDKGVEHVLRTILSETDVSMGLMGARTVKELNEGLLRKSSRLRE
ncbi:FMN-dependent alpha-hydroxy acid dehydrogenase-like protein [Meredithblackwellia eburnea MCA 4105]